MDHSPAWELGKGLRRPHCLKIVHYEVLHVTSNFDKFSEITCKIGNGHETET
jgi:hypothetical protein